MSVWERMGIWHLSPSSINTYISSPAVWTYQYIAKIRDGGNPKMWRGTAVEKGAHVVLLTSDMKVALAAAYDTYNELVRANLSHQFANTVDVTEQRQLIAPMLKQFTTWSPPEPFVTAQISIKLMIDKLPIPIIGFLDFAFDETDVDLKSTEKIVNKLPADHARQVSIYREARGKRKGGLLYVTDKKQNYIDVDDATQRRCMDEVQETVFAMSRFLNMCDTREDAVRAFQIDWDHWRAPKERKTTEQIIAHMRGEVHEATTTF